MAKVKIPTPLLKLTENNTEVDAKGTTIREVIQNLETQYPGVEKRLLSDGKLNRFINLYVDGEDIRFADGLETPVSDENEVSIVPAISGG